MTCGRTLLLWKGFSRVNCWLKYSGRDGNGDGVGDTPHVINESNTDLYPLMTPYWNPGDINHDTKVDIFDVVLCASAYGCTPSDPNWNPHGGIVEPYGIVNIFDVVIIGINYGKEYTP